MQHCGLTNLNHSDSAFVESPAFGLPFKVFALTVVTLILVWGARLWQANAHSVSDESAGWFLAAGALLVYTEWHILRSKTKVTATHLEQSWIWKKQVARQELAYAKVVRVRGLEWLIAPRLYARTVANKIVVFYGCSEAMLAEFSKVERQVRDATRP